VAVILSWGWGELKGMPGWRSTAWKEEEEGETDSVWATEARGHAPHLAPADPGRRDASIHNKR